MSKTHVQNKLIKGTSIILLLTLATSPISYVIRMIFSRVLSIQMFGLFYSVLGLFWILITFNDLGFGYSVEYFVPKFLRKKDFASIWKLYKYDQFVEVGTSILLSSILFLNADWLALHYFKVPIAAQILKIFCLYFISNSFVSSLQRLFIGLQKEIFYGSVEFVRSLFCLTLCFICVLLKVSNITNFSYIWASSFLLVGVVYNFLMGKYIPELKSKLSWDYPFFKKMAVIALPTLITSSTYLLITNSDTLFLTLFRSVSEVGIYNIIFPIVSIPIIFSTPLNRYLMPLISHQCEEEIDQVKLLLESLLKIVPFVGLYFGVFIATYPTASVTILFGSQWKGLVEGPLMLMSVIYLLSLMSTLFFTFLSGLGLIKEKLRISIFVAVTDVILGSLFCYLLGIYGIILANAILFGSTTLLSWMAIRKRLKVNLPLLYYLKYIFLFGGFWFVNRAVHFSPQNLVQFLLCGIFYTVLVFGFGMWQKVIDQSLLNDISTHIKRVSRL